MPLVKRRYLERISTNDYYSGDLKINMKRVKKGIRSSQKTILEWLIENSETGMTFIEH